MNIKFHKEEKIILSSLFNNYSHNNYKIINLKKTLNITPIQWKTQTLIKRTLLWLGKEYDTNSLYPWTQQQKIIKNQILCIQNNIKKENIISFHTHKRNRRWTVQSHNTILHTHYSLFLDTSTNNNKSKQQLNLKHITNNTHIKNIINTTYGKWATKTIKNKTILNNLKTTAIIEFRKHKLKQTTHTRRKKIDSNNSYRKEINKKQKGKTGYQKNELLNTHTNTKDYFKICNVINTKLYNNKIHIQYHRKLKH